MVKQPTDRDQFRVDLVAFVSLYRGRRLGEVNMAALVSQLLALLRKHRLQLPSEMAALLKFFLMIEGIGVRLDPEFNLGALLGPYAQQLHLGPLLTRGHVPAAADLGTATPPPSRSTCPTGCSGCSTCWTRPASPSTLRARSSSHWSERIERIGDRLVAGIVVAAFIRSIGELAVRGQGTLGPLGRSADGHRAQHVRRARRLPRLDRPPAETPATPLTAGPSPATPDRSELSIRRPGDGHRPAARTNTFSGSHQRRWP